MNVLRDLVPRPPTRFLGGRQQQHQEHLVLPDGNSLCVYTRHETAQQSTPLCVIPPHTHTDIRLYEDDKKEEDKETIKELVHPRSRRLMLAAKSQALSPLLLLLGYMEGNYMAV